MVAGIVSLGGYPMVVGPSADDRHARQLGRTRGADKSPFGKTPGAGGSGPMFNNYDSLLGGRAGAATPKGISSSISTPGMMGSNLFNRQGIARTVEAPAATIPASGSLALPPTEEDLGLPDGLTLDQAIDRLVHENLDLKSKFYEIPQAKADILTASLRANPIFYADSQLIPYGQYTRDRPGGQTQYDVNISYPLDLSRKRQARTVSAIKATKVTEAQYQDAVRQTIDNLYSGYIDVLQARRTIAFSEAGLEGLRSSLKATEDLEAGRASRRRATWPGSRIQVNLAEQQLLESQRGVPARPSRPWPPSSTSRPTMAESIELRGTLKYRAGSNPPPLGEMIQIALANRPDIIAYRLGVDRAKSDVKLQLRQPLPGCLPAGPALHAPGQHAVRPQEPGLLGDGRHGPAAALQPEPGEHPAVQAERRSQTQVELASVERQAIQEVQQAEREFLAAKAAVERIETQILPDSTMLLQDAKKLFPSEIDGPGLPGRAEGLQRQRSDLPRQPGPAPPGDARTSTRRSASGSCPDRSDAMGGRMNRKRGESRAGGRREVGRASTGFAPFDVPPRGGRSLIPRLEAFSVVHQALDDAGEVGAGVGQAVEVVLALAAGGDDPAVAEQGQVMADRRLALAELGAEGADVLLALG